MGDRSTNLNRGEFDVARGEFFARYAAVIGGWNWLAVTTWLGHAHPYPQSPEAWRALGAEVRMRLAGK